MIALIALAGMLDVLRQADARVAAVAWRLQTANVRLCADATALAGFSVETLDQYTVAERVDASAQFGLRDWPQISAVAPGSAAEKAGLRAGDEIVAVDDTPVPPARGGKPSYARTAAIEAVLAAALTRPPVKLTLASRTVYLTGDRGCPSDVQLVPGGRFDASADGHYNYRLSNVCAAIGVGQLEVLADRVVARRTIFAAYRDRLGQMPGIRFVDEPTGMIANRWLTTISIDPAQAGFDRVEAQAALEGENIESRPLWKPMHLQPLFGGAQAIEGKEAARAFEMGLCLPSGSAMTVADVERVCGLLRGLTG